MRIVDAPALMPPGRVHLVRDERAVPDAAALLRWFAPQVEVAGLIDLARAGEVPASEPLVVCSPDWFSVANQVQRGGGDPLVLLVPADYPWGYLELARSLAGWPDQPPAGGVQLRHARDHATRWGKLRLADAGGVCGADRDALQILRERADPAALSLVRDRLADEDSRAALDALLTATPDQLFQRYLHRVFRGVQYLDCGRFFAGMTIVDGGIQEGFELPYYAAHTAGDVDLVCVDPSGVERLSSFAAPTAARLGPRLQVDQRALWSTSGRVALPISETGAVLSQFKGHDTRFREVTFDCVTVDDLVAERGLSRVDLIKLDVEGAEPEVLLGMKETVARFRPQLAISIYHWPEHMWQLPLALMSDLEGYDFHLRHYSYGRWECILYALPRPGA